MDLLIIIIAVVFMVFILIWSFSVSPFLGFLISVVFVVLGTYSERKSKERKSEERYDQSNKLYNLQSNVANFTISQKFNSPDLITSIMLDEERKKICFVNTEQYFTEVTEVFDYKDILESEIIVDGKTITNTSRSSQLGGAIIGGVLAGGVGAVIGGLSGKTSSEEEISKVDLKIVVNNTKSPIKTINFFKNIVPVKKDDTRYKNAMSSIDHWHSILSLVIKQTESDETKKTNDKDVKNTFASQSVADEIKKLVQLKNDGILSEEEFNQQKQKVLTN